MERKVARALGIRQDGDILEVRIKDWAKNTYFKRRASISNKQEIKKIFDSLRFFGIDVNEINALPEKKKEFKEETWW